MHYFIFLKKGESIVLLAVTATETMSEFLTTIGTFVTQAISWSSSVLDTIVSSPALTVCCLGMPIVGFAVGLLGRLFRTN